MYGLRLVVAYDGREFCGWQRQPGYRTVEEDLANAIQRLTGEPPKLRGCSRTDSGVHAMGQLVGFDSPRDIPPHGWVRGINGKLADDVAVTRVERCAVGWDPRRDAASKTYRYLLHLGPVRDPLLRGRVWHLGPRRARPVGTFPTKPEEWLDVDAMREAAKHLEGTHDFKAFKTVRDPREQTVRTLFRVEVFEAWANRPDLLAIEVHGNAFMHNMMRILVGTLVEVGRERMSVADVDRALELGDRDAAGETAPPGGLYLVSIELGREAVLPRRRSDPERGAGR